MSTAPDIVRRGPVLAALAVTVAAGLAVVGWAAVILGHHAPEPMPGVSGASRPAPLIGPSPALQERVAAEATLHSWGWVDPVAGTVHMPIEEAMARVAAGAP